MELDNKKQTKVESSGIEEKADNSRFDIMKALTRLESAVQNLGKTSASDALAPAAVCEKCETVGVTKSKLNITSMAILGIMAGLFIGFGGVFFTIVTTNSGLGFGMGKLIGGLVFCLGLILVVVAGAELFTGNNLIVVGWLSGRLKFTGLLKNWSIVYISNLAGSLILVGLMVASDQWMFNNHAVGANALNIANAKVNLSFGTALARGILCNILVCLAVWLSFSARTVTDKIMAVVFPITAFVAAGFEHSVANMYFIPMGIMMANQPAVLEAAGVTAENVANLSWAGFLGNLVPVTIGNIIGGVAVGVVYWLSYLRKDRASEVVTVRPWVKKIFPALRNVEPVTAAESSPVHAKVKETSRKK